LPGSQDYNDYELHNCPFCGSIVLEMKKTSVDHCFMCGADIISEDMQEAKKIGYEYVYHVFCNSCGARGPIAMNDRTAADRWNKMK
jgi:predicted RNA-binding Zn-ribbon protein involved in translation (DUF1610 family)